MTCDYDKCHAKQEWHALITSLLITGEFDTGSICRNHPNLAKLHLLGPSHEGPMGADLCWTTFFWSLRFAAMGVGRTSHPSSCSDEAAMWTSPCLEPGCGSCWAQLGCRKYMEISDWARLTSSFLDILRGVETDPVRFLGVHALITHRWPILTINCFWDPTAWNSWRWELLVGGPGGASSNEQIPRMPMIPRNSGALLLTTLKCGFHKKEPAFWMQTITPFWPTSEKKNIGLFDFMTSWLYGEKWPVTTLLFDRCLHHLQDAASSEQSLSATLPDQKLTAGSQHCERYPL